MLPPNTRTIYESTDTDIQNSQWTLTKKDQNKKDYTIILNQAQFNGHEGRIKGYWLIETEELTLFFSPNFELMAGLNPHPVLKNPELIMLGNLSTVASAMCEAMQGIHGMPVKYITYGNFFIYPKQGKIVTECSYFHADYVGASE